MPSNIEAEQPLEEFYALTEEQMVSMGDPARIAWALTRIQGLPGTEALDSEQLTSLLKEVSLLPDKKDDPRFGDAMKELVREKRVDREGFAGTGKTVHLSLNHAGHIFLEKAVEKAKA